MTLDHVCEIAPARGAPVTLDSASMFPPRKNLERYLNDDADK